MDQNRTAALCAPDTLYSIFERCRYATYTHTENDASYAFEREGGRLYLLFEKSNGATDWYNNLDFPAVPYSNAGSIWFCHRGFLRVWRTLKPLVSDVIAQPGIDSITVVGYSHGAALAVFAHEYVWFHRPELRQRLTGYGFGCPRVLWGFCVRAALAERWERFFVIRNMDDLVTHLPPLLLGYRHVGHLLEVGKAGLYGRVDAHRPEHYEEQLRAEAVHFCNASAEQE